MRTIEINIGGHNEIVRWWSASYWKMRKFREREFATAVEARKQMWRCARELQEKARAGPRTGTPEWIRLRQVEFEAQYKAANLDQIEEVMPGADARRVAAFLAYEKSWRCQMNQWARERGWTYWRTVNFYQAVMHAFFKAVVSHTNHTVGLYDLNAAEKIRVGRLRGNGYHGCGARQQPRMSRRHGIG